MRTFSIKDKNFAIDELAAVVLKNPDGTHEVISIEDQSDWNRVDDYVKSDGCEIIKECKTTGEADKYIDSHNLVRAYSKEFSTEPESKDRVRTENLWLPGHGAGDAVDRARSMADKITDLDKIIRRMIAVYDEAIKNHPDEAYEVVRPFYDKAYKLRGGFKYIPDEIIEFISKGNKKAASKTFGMKSPGYYRVKAGNSEIDIEIARLKWEIANKKVKLAQLNEAKIEATNKDLFIDQMNNIRADIDKIEGNIEKLKSKYKEYKEV